MHNSNWFYDQEEKAYIEAVFKNGRFIDAQTGRPIILKDNARARIAVSIYSVPSKEDEKKHKEIKNELFLKSGSELNFHFYYDSKSYAFKLVLLQDLFLTKKGNQHSKLLPCKCMVYKPNENHKKDFEADSLNQAFTKASVKYRPNNKSHTCNVFKAFHHQRRELENIRPF